MDSREETDMTGSKVTRVIEERWEGEERLANLELKE